jgi:hypothetical protein
MRNKQAGSEHIAVPNSSLRRTARIVLPAASFVSQFWQYGATALWAASIQTDPEDPLRPDLIARVVSCNAAGIAVRITNRGTATSGPSTTYLRVEQVVGAKLVAERLFPTSRLTPGQSQEHFYSSIAYLAGNPLPSFCPGVSDGQYCEPTVQSDSSNLIRESNESNNVVAKRICPAGGWSERFSGVLECSDSTAQPDWKRVPGTDSRTHAHKGVGP